MAAEAAGRGCSAAATSGLSGLHAAEILQVAEPLTKVCPVHTYTSLACTCVQVAFKGALKILNVVALLISGNLGQAFRLEGTVIKLRTIASSQGGDLADMQVIKLFCA